MTGRSDAGGSSGLSQAQVLASKLVSRLQHLVLLLSSLQPLNTLLVHLLRHLLVAFFLLLRRSPVFDCLDPPLLIVNARFSSTPVGLRAFYLSLILLLSFHLLLQLLHLGLLCLLRYSFRIRSLTTCRSECLAGVVPRLAILSDTRTL